jgi:hypothetical protein
MVKKLHADEFHDTYFSAYVIRIIKSRTLRLFEPADETGVQNVNCKTSEHMEYA